MCSYHECTLHGGGASEGCRPKLPRWPFSGSSCTQAAGTAVHGSIVGSHERRVKLFSAAPRMFRAPRAASLVRALLPSASFLAPCLANPRPLHCLFLCQHRLCRTPCQHLVQQSTG